MERARDKLSQLMMKTSATATMMSCFNSVSLINLCRRVPHPAAASARIGEWNEGAGERMEEKTRLRYSRSSSGKPGPLRRRQFLKGAAWK